MVATCTGSAVATPTAATAAAAAAAAPAAAPAATPRVAIPYIAALADAALFALGKTFPRFVGLLYPR